MAINITTNTGTEQKIETFEKGQEKNEAAQSQPEAKSAKQENIEENTTAPAQVANDEVDEQDDFNYLSNSDEAEIELDEESEDEYDDDPEDEMEDETANAPKKSGFKKRIDKLTKRNSDLEYRLAQMEAKLNGNAPAEKTAEAAPNYVAEVEAELPKPKLSDFEEYDEYIEALTDWKLEVKELAKEKANREAQIKSKTEEITNSWKSKVAEASKVYKDWANVEKATDIPLTTFMRQEILASDVGAHIVYYLYKNPSKATEIAQMLPQAQIKAIGKLEGKLEERIPKKSNTAPAEKITKAPAPVKPISKTSKAGSGITNKKPSEMSYKEFKAHRAAQSKNK